MEGPDALDDRAFRAEVRGWVEAHYPGDLRFPARRLHWAECRAWYPDAGSDLASLRTEAVAGAGRWGDHWVVNGQKIWTTLASDANWMFLLARTDKTSRPQAGISFLLVPMDSPGITVRPIRTIELHDEFCEVFFDDVKVPKRWTVVAVNDGWTMARNLLGFERVFIGSPRQAVLGLGRLKLLAEHMGVLGEAAFLDRYTRLRMDLADFKALHAGFVERIRRGEAPGADVSMLKVIQTELYQRITDTMLEISGGNAGLLEPIEGERALHPSGLFIQARAGTIYGGSNEIQRNILVRNVLGLPG